MVAKAQRATSSSQRPLREHELTALWLLGRVPDAAFPAGIARVLRPGRAGRGPGPDVREASVLLDSGVVRSGAVEVHLRASDFRRHGHHRDPAYGELLLHLVWEDDLRDGDAGGAPASLGTVAVAPALRGDPERLRKLVRRGPAGREPCVDLARRSEHADVVERVRLEGRRRLAERSWAAARLAAMHGWDGAWARLLERSLASSAGRRRETHEDRAALAHRVQRRLRAASGVDNAEAGSVTASPCDALPALRTHALAERPGSLIEALRGDGTLGRGRSAEAGWNAALPLLIAAAAAFDDIALARATAALAARWPAPRPYGRSAALRANLEGANAANRRSPAPGALYAQGLLHLQDAWCERGGCGVCPLSEREAAPIPPEPGT